MKKIIFVSMMLCAILSAKAQSAAFVDDAVQGTGTNQHHYVGSWRHNTTSPTFYNSTLSYSNQTDAYVELTFIGNRVLWYTEKKNTHGIAAVSIDGGVESFIDLFSVYPEQRVMVYSSPTLTPGTHTFKIRATSTKNPASTGFYAIHDYLLVENDVLDPQSGSTNTSTGDAALTLPVFGSDNSAFGYNALHSVPIGTGNTAIGSNALSSSANADNNTGVGNFALHSCVGGHGNTAVGSYSFFQIQAPGFSNTAIGYASGPAYSGQLGSTAIGAVTYTTASYQVRIGNESVTNIGGQVSWSTLSDGRFKRDIREDVSGLEFVNKLRPVSYTIDKSAVRKFLGVPDSLSQHASEAREKPIRQTGFVAQEVEALIKKSSYVFNGVDAPQNEHDTYTIRYAEFVVPLVKAVQELTAKNEEQQKQIDQLVRQIGKNEAGNNEALSANVSLLQNNPNPFSLDTEIKMVLPETARNANIIVYNLEGKQLKDLVVKQRGNATITILGNELSAGMYIYALIVDGKVVDTKRMILTR